MPNSAPACPQCTLENTYPEGSNFVCADCGHEWPMAQAAASDDEDDAVVKDSNGQTLRDGDAVVLINPLPPAPLAAPDPPAASRWSGSLTACATTLS